MNAQSQPRTVTGRYTYRHRSDSDITLPANLDHQEPVLPDETWVALYLAHQRAADLDSMTKLEATTYAWLHANGHLGSPLDTHASTGSDTLEFLTPEGDLLHVHVHDAATLARQYRNTHGLFVCERSPGVWRIEMVAWP